LGIYRLQSLELPSMLGLLFALAVACPYNQQPCVYPHAPPPAYGPSYQDQRPDYRDERETRDHRDRHDDRGDRAYGGQDTTRETATPDGYIRETWGPTGYVRERWGAQSTYEQNGAAEHHAYRDFHDEHGYRDDRDRQEYDDRGYEPEPGVYDRYGDRYDGGAYDRRDAYDRDYDSRCGCWSPPVSYPIPQGPLRAETVDLRGWGMIGGVSGDYYGGGGGGGGGGAMTGQLAPTSITEPSAQVCVAGGGAGGAT
jgi:hypothetical protein